MHALKSVKTIEMTPITVTQQLPKFIHLDLKGAPPKLAYLSELLPLFRRMGATGLVLEYEDTFPFSGDIKHLAGANAYSPSELRAFILECRNLQMTVVPLIQTFGHVEFILKHQKHRHLREHKLYPNSICPSSEEAFALLARMLDQVIDFHIDQMPIIHIGCDEVHQLGVCPQCRERMSVRGWTNVRLFCEHVNRVAAYIRARLAVMGATVRIQIWDDMLRGADFMHDVAPSGVQDAVEPVMWYYGADAIPDVWSFLCHFGSCWAATAFKGASGPNETTPDTSLHVANHKLWLAVMQDQRSRISWAGVILTGWSRYDHFGVLCELLPAALPSLSMCLQTMIHGEFTESTHASASNLVGYGGSDRMIPVTQRPRPCNVIEHWNFPGQTVYIGSHQQSNLYAATCGGFFSSDWFRGWFSRYNEERQHLNVGMVGQLHDKSESLLAEWTHLRDFMTLAMGPVYKQSIIDEWLGTHVDPLIDKLNRVSERTDAVVKRERWPNGVSESKAFNSGSNNNHQNWF